MYKNLFMFIVAIGLSGCGADSELLRDQNINKKPSGKAYDIIKKDVYQYRDVNQTRLGFDYLSIDEECSTKECTMLSASYVFENKESTSIPENKKIVLTSYGWFEKSQHRECKVDFSGDSLVETCPDGRKLDIKIVEKDLEGVGLNQLPNAVVYFSKLRDQQATFTYMSKQYDFNEKSESDIYEVVDDESSKCKTNNHIARNDNMLTSHTELTCAINGMTFQINNVASEAGTYAIDGVANHTWKKQSINDKYVTIDLGDINGQNYFVSAYNSYIRVGIKIPKQITKSYINTDAFNVIYTQLKDAYK